MVCFEFAHINPCSFSVYSLSIFGEILLWYNHKFKEGAFTILRKNFYVKIHFNIFSKNASFSQNSLSILHIPSWKLYSFHIPHWMAMKFYKPCHVPKFCRDGRTSLYNIFQLLDEEVRISKLLAIKRDLAFIFFEILAQSFENFLEIR